MFMKQRFAITHTLCQTKIPALLHSLATHTPSVKMLCPQQNCFPYIFMKT